MNIEFEWKDLVDLVDEASSDDINRIAHAISDIINVVNSNGGGNVDLSDYVKNTDYATKEVAGVVKINPSAGIRLTDNNQLTVSYATKSYIDAKASYVNPIVPALLEYAVQSCTNQDIEAELSEEQLKLPPSAKYLKDSYYTKEETDSKDADIRATAEFALGQVTNFQYDLDLKENLSNKTNTISDMPSIDKYPSEVAVFEKFMSFDNDIKSYIFSYTTSQFYTKDQTDNKISDAIGNIETALENIIEKYGLGGDAS